MPSRNELCPCGSGRKYKQCCLGAARRSSGSGQPPPREPTPPEVDAVISEAAVLGREVFSSPDPIQGASDVMVLLREMFREGGPLAALRWSWDELVPVVERHIFRVMEEVESMDERRARLFDRCAPELIDPERVERFDRELRRVLMEPGRTPEERRALAVAVLELWTAPRHPPYTQGRHRTMAWLMMAQVTEWAARRERMRTAVLRASGGALGESRGPEMDARALRQALEEPDVVMAAAREAAEADPLMLDMVEKYERALLLSILYGRTPEVLHGEEWLWLTVVLREPLRVEPERAADVDVETLYARLDEEVKQAILSRVEAASRDRSSLPEAQQWFEWAYKILQVRPMAFYGAFAKARAAPLFERFEGEADLVWTLQGRERWSAEDLEGYRLHLDAHGAHGAAQRVRRLQALLRGESAPAGPGFKM